MRVGPETTGRSAIGIKTTKPAKKQALSTSFRKVLSSQDKFRIVSCCCVAIRSGTMCFVSSRTRLAVHCPDMQVRNDILIIPVAKKTVKKKVILKKDSTSGKHGLLIVVV